MKYCIHKNNQHGFEVSDSLRGVDPARDTIYELGSQLTPTQIAICQHEDEVKEAQREVCRAEERMRAAEERLRIQHLKAQT